MNFLVDAQLPVRLAEFLSAAGYDAIHALSLPNGNRTSDAEICVHADTDGRTVVTKDRDFRDSHLLRNSPRSLLIVSTGNVSNRELLAVFDRHLDEITAFLSRFRLLELTGDALIAHSSPDDQ